LQQFYLFVHFFFQLSFHNLTHIAGDAARQRMLLRHASGVLPFAGLQLYVSGWSSLPFNQSSLQID
jgi:hypothetical protein